MGLEVRVEKGTANFYPLPPAKEAGPQADKPGTQVPDQKGTAEAKQTPAERPSNPSVP